MTRIHSTLIIHIPIIYRFLFILKKGSRMKKWVILSVLFLCSCSPSITVRTLYSSANRLPSVQMDTPDPTKPLLGRAHILSIHWSSPKLSSPTLRCFFRFADREIIEKTIPLEGTSGSLNYEIDQALFREHGSLISYKIILMHEDKELTFSQHKLWVSPIVISHEK